MITPEEVIKRLKNNGFIKTPSGATIRMIDGVIVRCFKDGRYTINASVGNSEVDRECGETFEITKTGKYKMKDGRTAYISYIETVGDKITAYGCHEHWSRICKWDECGSMIDNKNDGLDLVEYIGD